MAAAGTFATDSRNVDNAGCVGDTDADHTEPVFSLQERKQETAAEDVAEPGDWDDAMDFDIDLPDGNATAEMAADDITSADDIASMEIELPDLDLFTGLGTLDVNTEETVPADPPKNFGRDTGRSGKKYTAEELEALIKE